MVSALVMVALLGSVGLVTVTSGAVEGSRARAVAELGVLATLNWVAGAGSEVVIVNGCDVAAIEADMKGGGRVLVRPSGTEALIRVMVEADSDALLARTMDALILRIQQEAETN